jgi:hypothetical protein
MRIRLDHSTQPPELAQPENSIAPVTPARDVRKQPIKPTRIMVVFEGIAWVLRAL